jgi:hypothetical protein
MGLWTKIGERYKTWVDEGLAGVVQKIIRAMQFVLAWFALIVFAAWSIPPLRKFLEDTGYFDDKTIGGILGVLVVVILYSLTELSRRTKNIDKAVESLVPSQSALLENGINDVYNPLLRELGEVPEKERTLDVLGLVLYTAWPQLEGWLNQKNTAGWTINLPGYAHDATIYCR